MQKRSRALAALALVAAGALVGACGGGDDDSGSTEARIDALNERIDALQDQVDELTDAAESLAPPDAEGEGG